jgi:hypothetical protein
MTDSAAGNSDSNESVSAEPRRSGEQELVQVEVRELLKSLEAKIPAEAVLGRAVGIAILLTVFLVILTIIQVPGWVIAICLPISLILTVGFWIVRRETRQVRRAAGLFTQRFPEGSRNRMLAIGELSKVKQPWAAGHKLLEALLPPEKTTSARSGRELVGCLAGIILYLGVTTIGIFAWLKAVETFRIDENIKNLVWGIMFGGWLWVLSICMKWPGLKGALIQIPRYAILGIITGIVVTIQRWISRIHGEGPALAFLVVVGPLLYLVITLFSRWWPWKASGA